jgi:hypothetical protein
MKTLVSLGIDLGRRLSRRQLCRLSYLRLAFRGCRCRAPWTGPRQKLFSRCVNSNPDVLAAHTGFRVQ